MINSRLFQRLVNLKTRLSNARNIRLDSVKRGGGGHGHSQTELTGWRKFLMEPEHPHAHRGYLYRECGNLQGSTNAFVGKLASTFAWYWIFYNLWSHPEFFWGHMEYPDTSKWTNAELGIPDDDQD